MSSSAVSDGSWNVTFFFFAGPRSIFDLAVVEFVAIYTRLGASCDEEKSISVKPFAFSRVFSFTGSTGLADFVAVEPFGRPRVFGTVSVFAGVAGLVLGLPARFFGASD